MNPEIKTEAQNTQDTRLAWQTPEIASSEVFTRAALACCIDGNGDDQGSTGVNVPC